MIKQEAIAYYAFDAVEELSVTTNDPRVNTYVGHTDNYDFEDEMDAIIKFYCPTTKRYYKEFAEDRKVVAFLIYKSIFFPKTIQLLGTDGMMFKYVKSRGIFTSCAIGTRDQTGTLCWEKRVPVELQDEYGPKIRITVAPEIYKTFIDATYNGTAICYSCSDANGSWIRDNKSKFKNIEVNSLFTRYGDMAKPDYVIDKSLEDHDKMQELAEQVNNSMEEN